MILAALTHVLAACEAPPVQQIRAFSDGVVDMRAAGNAVLDPVVPIVASVGTEPTAAGCANDRFGVPRCFDPSLVGTTRTVPDPPPIALRRHALQTVTEYAEVLIYLGSGEGEAEVRARAGELADAASGVATILGAVAGGPAVGLAIQGLREPLAGLAGKLAAARDRVALREAILEYQGLIKSVLTALERDTRNLYAIYYVRRQDDRRVALVARDARAAEAAGEDTRRFYEALDAYVRALRATSRALDLLTEAATESGRPTPANVSLAAREAVEFRVAARSFLDAARRVEDASRRGNGGT